MPKTHITVLYLAKKLGLSAATVSRALNNKPDVSESTRKKVMELARELNFRKNSMAVMLRKQESKLVGIVVPDLDNHFFAEAIKGISQVLEENGFNFILCQSGIHPDKEAQQLQLLMSQRVDGILITANIYADGHAHFEELKTAGIPTVFFDQVPESAGEYTRVVIDDYKATYEAISFLLDKGYDRIAIFTNNEKGTIFEKRTSAYCHALTDRGIPVDPKLIFETRVMHQEDGSRLANELLKLDKLPNALFTSADYLAIGAMRTLKANNIQIPNDIAIMTFADWMLNELVDPPLSAVHQPSYAIGARAAQELLTEIHAFQNDQKTSPRKIVLDTKLNIRASC